MGPCREIAPTFSRSCVPLVRLWCNKSGEMCSGGLGSLLGRDLDAGTLRRYHHDNKHLLFCHREVLISTPNHSRAREGSRQLIGTPK